MNSRRIDAETEGESGRHDSATDSHRLNTETFDFSGLESEVVEQNSANTELDRMRARGDDAQSR